MFREFNSDKRAFLKTAAGIGVITTLGVISEAYTQTRGFERGLRVIPELLRFNDEEISSVELPWTRMKYFLLELVGAHKRFPLTERFDQHTLQEWAAITDSFFISEGISSAAKQSTYGYKEIEESSTFGLTACDSSLFNRKLEVSLKDELVDPNFVFYNRLDWPLRTLIHEQYHKEAQCAEFSERNEEIAANFMPFVILAGMAQDSRYPFALPVFCSLLLESTIYSMAYHLYDHQDKVPEFLKLAPYFEKLDYFDTVFKVATLVTESLDNDELRENNYINTAGPIKLLYQGYQRGMAVTPSQIYIPSGRSISLKKFDKSLQDLGVQFPYSNPGLIERIQRRRIA